MTTPTVSTDDVRKLVADGAQLVEVLPKDDYQREHIPGALSLPLSDMTAEAVAALDRDRTVVVYCYDHECDLSARAAALLEVDGFNDVRHYAASKTAWLGAAVPGEGTVRDEDRAGAIADPAVPTCAPGDRIGDLGRTDPLLVVIHNRVVVGTLHQQALGLPATTLVRDAMATAPATVRPSILHRPLAESMDRNGESLVSSRRRPAN